METAALALPPVPDWTREDYASFAPFEWLYQYREDRFVLAQLTTQIRAKAGAVGCKNFVTLWKAYLESRRADLAGQVANATDFPDQPVELACGEYVCGAEGITRIDRYGFEVSVCPHPLLPVRRIVNIDTGEVKTELAYRRDDSGWRTLVVDKAVLSSAQQIVQLSRNGLEVNSENARELVRYLSYVESLNYDLLPQALSVGRLGWMDGHGFSPYVEHLLFDGDQQYRSLFSSVQPHGEYAAWLNAAREARAGNVVTHLFLAASFASVLIHPLGALPFLVHLWGGTEAGKTVALMLAASVWADPAMGRYAHTYDGTVVGQEMLAGFCNSLPLCLDELQSIKSQKDFDGMIYRLCEGEGRVRGKREGGLQRTQTWQNCTLSTGEMPLSNSNSGGGALNRILEIDCKDTDLVADDHALVETLRLHYGHAGRRFVQALTPDLLETARATQSAYYQQLLLTGATEKQAMAASLILTADMLAELTLFQDDLVLTAEDIAPYLVSGDLVNVNARAYDWLMGFVASNPARFEPDSYGGYSGECWGMSDERFFYLNKSVFDLHMRDAGFHPQAFLSWAKGQGLIETGTEPGRYAKKKYVKGLPTAPWFIWLRKPPDGATLLGEGEAKALFPPEQQRLPTGARHDH